MSVSNFIPTVWSETLYQELEKKYIGVAHCNRAFEGDIREKGNKVRICGLNGISVDDYERNINIGDPTTLSDNVTEMSINYAKFFNFQIDDIDRVQGSEKLMSLAMKNAADALAYAADRVVFDQYYSAKIMYQFSGVNEENIIDKFLRVRTRLYEQGVVNSDDIVIEVTPRVAETLIKAKVGLYTDNASILESGYIGSIAGCKVYATNALTWNGGDPDDELHQCIVRTKRSLAFAEQLSEIEAYRPEKRFADAVKGLYLFGCKIIYPEEFIAVELALAPNPSSEVQVSG